MKAATTRLRNNAFDEHQEIFLTVNIDEEKKRVARQGIEDGQKNIPRANAAGLSELEYGIVEQIKQTAQQTHQALSRHFTVFSSRLIPFEEFREPQAKINGINDTKKNMEQELEDEINQFEQMRIIKKGRWQDAEKSYEQFRQENHLTRSANYSLWRSVVILFVILIIEASLNAFLLIDFVGLLPAFGQTVLITAVNVVLGAAIVGLLWRYKNVISWKQRWLASISIFFAILVLIFNLGVGHYRDALTEAKAREEQPLNSPDWETFDPGLVDYDFVDYTERAMDRMKSSLFDIDSVLSVLLVVVGIGCFGFSTYKWYSMLDPCPGYKSLDEERNLAHKEYTELIRSVRTKIDRIITTAEGRIADERDKTINLRSKRADLVKRAESLRNNYMGTSIF